LCWWPNTTREKQCSFFLFFFFFHCFFDFFFSSLFWTSRSVSLFSFLPSALSSPLLFLLLLQLWLFVTVLSFFLALCFVLLGNALPFFFFFFLSSSASSRLVLTTKKILSQVVVDWCTRVQRGSPQPKRT
jgi:hypothetical protein